MEQQVSAAEKAMKHPQYLPWLHQLTHVGYDKGIFVETDHQEVIGYYFLSGETPESAMDKYKSWKVRYNACKQAGEL